MILKYNELSKIKEDNLEKKIAICKGTFDLFHYSHLKFLQYIKRKCDILVVIVKNDKAASKKGSNRPIFSEKERIEIVDSIKYVDYVVLEEDNVDSEIIKKFANLNLYSEDELNKFKSDAYLYEKINADYLFVTNEKKISKLVYDLCSKIELQIKIIPIQGNNFHTTDIINKIINH